MSDIQRIIQLLFSFHSIPEEGSLSISKFELFMKKSRASIAAAKVLELIENPASDSFSKEDWTDLMIEAWIPQKSEQLNADNKNKNGNSSEVPDQKDLRVIVNEPPRPSKVDEPKVDDRKHQLGSQDVGEVKIPVESWEKINTIVDNIFKKLDKENTNLLENSALMGFFNNGMFKGQGESLIKQIDVNKDGRISREEFAAFVVMSKLYE
mgnify:CR=1 FL=1